MISHIGKVNLELFKTLKVIRKEMEEGKEVDKEGELTVRFDFSIPMGCPYAIAKEVLAELAEEVTKMEETSKKQQEEQAAAVEQDTGDMQDSPEQDNPEQDSPVTES